jgi:hypothetical protein
MIADWIILLICIPAIVIPIVLLCGFAGCDQLFGLDHINPTVPTNVHAESRTLDSITIAWDSSDLTYLVKAWTDGDPEPDDTAVATTLTNSFVDSSLTEGQIRHYRVAARNPDTDDSSGFTDPFTANARFFQTACNGLQQYPGVDNVNSALDGMTLVQVINPPLLQVSGEYVRVVIRGAVNPAATPLALNGVYISTVASGGDPWDSDPSTLKTLFEWDGLNPLVVAQGQTFELPVIEFSLDQSQPLIIAFNVSSPSGSRYALVPDATFAVAHDKFLTQEAAIADRSAGYQESNALWYIEKIDVA